ncbi:S1C family serine protease [Polyangium aurulentum]|uniref:S1C family serine protease n=1 Tax=Polyangium aurulentum TaxID=2567896 RepID=UPI0010AE083E|nr:trypsin-like peptidase domain-containing protein [Polyangium aurulentum]UQA58493.1 trypsin-like peptidase domain-containing protein [Polyangium aurulentum]
MKNGQKLLALLALIAIVFAGGYFVGRSRTRPVLRSDDTAAPVQQQLPPIPQELSGDEKRDIEVFRHAAPSVVFITSLAVQRDVFSFDVTTIPQGTGSGFIWDESGNIVTNFHVIQQGERFSVTLSDQSEWDAKVVGAAPEKDLAVLHIDAPKEKLIPLKVGRSRDLLVGQRVLAVGNPFGLDHSLTIGVISALGRELTSPIGRKIRDVVQTDAAINPGNSGGPLLDSSGRLVGVNTAIYSPSGASSGIGFAIPVDTVARLIPQLIEKGRASVAGIGVQLNPTLDRYARRAGIEGIVIYDVTEGSPAEKAGLEGVRASRGRRIVLGDMIVSVDGKRVRSAEELLDAFDQAGAGKEVKLGVVREGKEREVVVTLVAL